MGTISAMMPTSTLNAIVWSIDLHSDQDNRDATVPGSDREPLPDLLADPKAAAHAAREALKKAPSSRAALQLLASAMRRLGESDTAERAEVEALRLSLAEPLVKSATAALMAGRAGEAERHIRKHIDSFPNDAAALRILADVAARAGRQADAEKLLRRALELAPAFATARKELAVLLQKESRPDEAVAVIDARLADCPHSPDLLHLKSTLLALGGRGDEALAASTLALDQQDGSAVLWLSHGRLLASAGRKVEAVAAFRAATRIDGALGQAWWGIADTDVGQFNDEDIAEMRSAIETAKAAPQQRIPVHFALGRAFEERGDGEKAFKCFRDGHALRRRGAPYDADALTHFVDAHRKFLSPDFFARREGYGDRSEAPIFVVGMHRAGSTLVEQILASHPLVEGLGEPPQLAKAARQLGGDMLAGTRYLKALALLDAEGAQQLGAAYLQEIGRYRRSDRPQFVDKMPGNWRLLPFIQMILPSARIIDIRRDPFDCCISNYCRFFANGQDQADDLHDLGRYYRDYSAFLDIVDEALPARIIKLSYESLVDDAEAEVTRLLEACGLPFDERCLRFFETERSVRTPSANQVRKPINRNGIGRWKMFAPWLQPLADGLGARRPRS